MSVDDRLRAGLERNASSLVPAGEARLDAVRRRHRRRVLAVAGGGLVAVAATVALAFGLASGGVDRAVPPDPLPPAETSPVPPEAAGLIPDSTWRRVVTTKQAEAAGVPRSRIREDIGDDGRLPLELRLTTDTFTQSGDYGGSVWEIGDSGSVAYDERGRLVVTSARCVPCSALAVTWRIDDDRLVFTRLGPSNGPMDRVVWTGTWRRTS
ncbi:hypothetical protein SAMN05192575_102237 [Nocardioides alpinus]|uniref:Uncharacterized protein n=1 Tax=Nocardioides alpinus TaxID=748909 RepID=A0A1I0X946_9ACTN|nr:hypothetical protein [Nocardioides alpinus]PKH44207.1 hypothetical protein CXG46_01215 [Nocardioides alpinus]SFA97562.1 hypothetical protein SAMN05192575_102237 [Nocardioides alpinus]